MNVIHAIFLDGLLWVTLVRYRLGYLSLKFYYVTTRVRNNDGSNSAEFVPPAERDETKKKIISGNQTNKIF